MHLCTEESGTRIAARCSSKCRLLLRILCVRTQGLEIKYGSDLQKHIPSYKARTHCRQWISSSCIWVVSRFEVVVVNMAWGDRCLPKNVQEDSCGLLSTQSDTLQNCSCCAIFSLRDDVGCVVLLFNAQQLFCVCSWEFYIVVFLIPGVSCNIVWLVYLLFTSVLGSELLGQVSDKSLNMRGCWEISWIRFVFRNGYLWTAGCGNNAVTSYVPSVDLTVHGCRNSRLVLPEAISGIYLWVCVRVCDEKNCNGWMASIYC